MRLPHQPGKTTHIEKMIAADNVRNHMVARLVKQACDKDRNIVVFSTLVDHLKAIHRACVKAEGISGRQMGFYLGASIKAEKEQREREKVKPILFATYAMMSEGTEHRLARHLHPGHAALGRDAAGRPHPPRVPRQGPAGGDGRRRQRQPGVPGLRQQRLKWFKSIGCEIKDM